MFEFRLSRLVVGLAAVFAVISLAAALVSSPGAVLAADEVPCNGDHPLEVDGYQCSTLLNKGTGSTVGEAFNSLSGTTLTIYTNLFSPLSDTGHIEEKICLDDDANPYSSGTSCLGGTAEFKINDATPVSPPGNQEEAAGKYEFMIEGVQLTEGLGTGSGAGLAKYTISISTYTYASFHFNNGQLSIETFFQPEEQETPTPTPTPVSTHTPAATGTVVVVTETPTVDDTATPTPVATATPTAVSTSTPAGTPTVVIVVRTATVAGSTVVPGTTPSPVSTVLAGESTPTATPESQQTGVLLPSAGFGGPGLGGNIGLLFLAAALLLLAGAGAVRARRSGRD